MESVKNFMQKYGHSHWPSSRFTDWMKPLTRATVVLILWRLGMFSFGLEAVVPHRDMRGAMVIAPMRPRSGSGINGTQGCDNRRRAGRGQQPSVFHIQFPLDLRTAFPRPECDAIPSMIMSTIATVHHPKDRKNQERREQRQSQKHDPLTIESAETGECMCLRQA